VTALRPAVRLLAATAALLVVGAGLTACGDSGEGFKYSALMGEVLADLAEGDAPDDDVAALSLERFAGGVPVRRGPHVMGRH